MTKGKIMKSGPTTSWKKAGEKAEAETDFLCSGSIFTADSDSRHRIRIFFSLENALSLHSLGNRPEETCI